jgi:hypothetical protein
MSGNKIGNFHFANTKSCQFKPIPPLDTILSPSNILLQSSTRRLVRGCIGHQPYEHNTTFSRLADIPKLLYHKQEDTATFRNVGDYSPNNTASHSREPTSAEMFKESDMHTVYYM